jgi:hypothetical protein
MEHAEILKPVVALAIWTMVMWVWMYATRLPAMSKNKEIDVNNMVGGIGSDLDKVLPGKIQWIAHNYNHLHEAPTLFYAMCIVLAMTGWGDGMNATIAWVYVGLRVAHSLVQALWNRILVRFALFALSSIALIMLITHAAMAVFH